MLCQGGVNGVFIAPVTCCRLITLVVIYFLPPTPLFTFYKAQLSQCVLCGPLWLQSVSGSNYKLL